MESEVETPKVVSTPTKSLDGEEIDLSPSDDELNPQRDLSVRYEGMADADVSDELAGTARAFGMSRSSLVEIRQRCSPDVFLEVASAISQLRQKQDKIDELRESMERWNITVLPAIPAKGSDEVSSPASNLVVKTRPRLAQAVAVSAVPLVELLPAKFSAPQMEKFIAHLRSSSLNHVEDERVNLLSSGAIKSITTTLVGRAMVNQFDAREWLDWEPMELAEKLRQVFDNPDSTLMGSVVDWEVHFQQKCFLVLNVRDSSSMLKYVQCVYEVESEARTKTASEEKVVEGLVANLLKAKGGGSVPKANRTIHRKVKDLKPKSIEDFCNQMSRLANKAREVVEEADQWEDRGEAVKQANPAGNQPARQQAGKPSVAKDRSAKVNKFTCDGCGNEAPAPGNSCAKCAGHPDRNASGAWQDSAALKALRRALPHVPHPVLRRKWRTDGSTVPEETLKRMAELSETLRTRRDKGKAHKAAGKYLFSFPNARVGAAEHDDALIPLTLSTTATNGLQVRALLDTGATSENYVSEDVARWISMQETMCNISESDANDKSRVILGGTHMTCNSKGNVKANITIHNQEKNRSETIRCLKFRVIDTNIDMIIGLPSIRKHHLVDKVKNHFRIREISEENFISDIADDPDVSQQCFRDGPTKLECQSNDNCSLCAGLVGDNPTKTVAGRSETPWRTSKLGCTPGCISNLQNDKSPFYTVIDDVGNKFHDQKHHDEDGRSISNSDAPLKLRTVSSQNEVTGLHPSELSENPSVALLFAVNKEPVSELGPSRLTKDDLFTGYSLDDDEVVWKEDPFDFSPNEETDPNQVQVFGSEVLQAQLRSLCKEFTDIFSISVKAEPARVPPMEVKVDAQRWHTNKNRGPPRPQSEVRRAAIEKQVKKYLDLKVIEPSSASEYSQVHLVPKDEPNDFRFCLDFVRLNEATIGVEGWPIPNIPQMIQRIGSRKPRVFGVMDMTSGYHQAPLSASAQALCAFICFMGVFNWLRVPMGLKNAGPYFQRVMATVVLAGILYVICELYIDDVFVFGKDEDEFLANLRSVFQRFRRYNITLNPKKCRLGLAQVEFVGHVISAQGITFSDEKRLKVLNFPLPSKGKQLLGFLGLVNYFRDHLPDMTEKLKGLRSMVTNIKLPVVWTAELEQQFYAVRDLVANCPSLFFLEAEGEVVVMTDASDYGIGAYIYQVVNGVERPILFVSKSLHGAQLNWSTIEKEAYAIFYTLKTHDYLLRDIKFTLRTDHKNLTYLNLESSQKVRRWKLFLQEFNFDMEHVAGVNNPVADAFSRLCTVLPTQEDADWETPTLFRIEAESEVHIPDDAYHKIRKSHNSKVGHFGAEKTVELIIAHEQPWRYMRRHVRQFIRQCPVCQLSNDRKVAVKIAPFTRASYYPMEVVNIDTVGPLPEDEAGNKYILVLIDCFSRWVELYPSPDTSANSAAIILLQHCGRFGVPALIRSDKGSQFVNETIAQLVDLLGSDQDISTAYSKEENAIVERTNKEVMRHLRAIVYDDRIYSKWSTHQLPLVMRILNSQEKTRTGASPAELLFGNSVDLGRYIIHLPSTAPNPDRDLNEHMVLMLDRQRELISVAQETQREFDTHHMVEADPEFTDYPIHSYVLWDHPADNRSKIHLRYQGPFQVVERNQDAYKIQDLVSGKVFETHVTNLRPFNRDSARIQPEEVAQRNSQEFVIEQILEHQGNVSRRTSLQFKVRWLGYGPEEDTWEPYESLRDTEQLHDYLKANKLKSLIPKKFRNSTDA
jgi:transposase InsO family protein